MKRLDERLSDVAQRKVKVAKVEEVMDGIVEEGSELIQAIMKHRRGISNIQNLREEWSHNMIMLAQLKILLDVDICNQTLDSEIERLNKRIDEEAEDER